MDIATASQWTGLMVALSGIVIGLFRSWTKVRNSATRETLETKTSNQLIITMSEQIEALHKRVAELQESINELRNLELEGAGDFGGLEMVINNMPCVNCPTKGDAFMQLFEVINRMGVRRERRMLLLKKGAQ